MPLLFQNNILSHITFALFIMVTCKQKFAMSIVTKYQLESAAVVDFYYPIVSGDSIRISENSENAVKVIGVNTQKILFPKGQDGNFFAAGLRTVNAVPVLFWRFLHKRLLRWYSIGGEGELYSLRNTTTQSGLDIDLEVPENEYRDIKTKFFTVYPGTMWCGIGNKAAHDNSIGFFYATDNCCRGHDKCFDSIPGKTIRHGLTNAGQFSRSHCECDMKFYYCLKQAKSIVAHKIGVTYFNILRPQCFRKEHPIIECISWYDERCLTYVVDETREPIWQWFDNRVF